jgi:hypothetical protein
VQPIEGPNTTIAPRDRAHRHAEAPPPRGRASVIALNPVSPSPETPTPRLGLLQSPSGEMHRQPCRASFARRARSAHGASPQAAASGTGPGEDREAGEEGGAETAARRTKERSPGGGPGAEDEGTAGPWPGRADKGTFRAGPACPLIPISSAHRPQGPALHLAPTAAHGPSRSPARVPTV